MKKYLLIILMATLALSFSNPVQASGPVKIDVLYMNHGPLQDTLARLKSQFAGFGSSITVSWYDFESDAGEKFKAKKGIRQHVPLMIWINNSTTVKVDQKEVTFAGFPTGAGPVAFQGTWTIDTLKKAIDQTLVRK